MELFAPEEKEVEDKCYITPSHDPKVLTTAPCYEPASASPQHHQRSLGVFPFGCRHVLEALRLASPLVCFGCAIFVLVVRCLFGCRLGFSFGVFSSAVLSALCLFVCLFFLFGSSCLCCGCAFCGDPCLPYKGPFPPCSFSSLSNNSPSGLTHTFELSLRLITYPSVPRDIRDSGT